MIDRPKRWFGVFLRGLHLAAVITLGASILGAPIDHHASAMATLFTGLAMMALDAWGNPTYLRQASGLSVVVKLGFVAWLAVDAEHRLALFWLIVIGSAVFAHAPASFRHAELIRSR
jgi:hypothetical protein